MIKIPYQSISLLLITLHVALYTLRRMFIFMMREEKKAIFDACARDYALLLAN